jgi:hypothetical protein
MKGELNTPEEAIALVLKKQPKGRQQYGTITNESLIGVRKNPDDPVQSAGVGQYANWMRQTIEGALHEQGVSLIPNYDSPGEWFIVTREKKHAHRMFVKARRLECLLAPDSRSRASLRAVISGAFGDELVSKEFKSNERAIMRRLDKLETAYVDTFAALLPLLRQIAADYGVDQYSDEEEDD